MYCPDIPVAIESGAAVSDSSVSDSVVKQNTIAADGIVLQPSMDI